MAHRLVEEAGADLDEIWLYVAKESGSMEIADKLVLVCEASPWARTLSSTACRMTM